MTVETRIYNVENANLYSAVESTRDYYEALGYDTTVTISSEGYTVSIKKGNLFRKVLGLQTSLNITLTQINRRVRACADIGFFGTQAIPTAITAFVLWPVIVPQIVGIVKNLKLDKQVLDYIGQCLNCAA